MWQIPLNCACIVGVLTLFLSQTRSYTTVLTHLFSDSEFETEKGSKAEPGVWFAVEETEFLFYTNTTEEPMPLRETTNWYYLSQKPQRLGRALSGIALFLIFATFSWVAIYREEKIVKASQPEFLYLLCFGAMLVAPSSVFMSFDENNGKTGAQLDSYCASFPWFFVVGYLIMYCALFSKLWRLNQLLQLRRRAVEIKQVLVPFCLVIASSIIVLILWQILDPLRWEREVITEPEQPNYEQFGECTSSTPLFFVIPLGVLMFLTAVATTVFSWKLKDVQEELSEARWIFAGK